MKHDDDDIQDYVRPWVGLTKNEVELLSYIAEGNTWIAVELAEAKLKEKNNG
jgi:DNA-binding CsgD family transcriptional regulator